MRKIIGTGLAIIVLTFVIFFIYDSMRTSPIKDEVLREKILEELQLVEVADDKKRPTKSDLKELTILYNDDYLREEQVETLKGLEHAENLEELVINFNEISDLKPLAQLTRLHTLDLTYTAGDELYPFEMGKKKIKDIGPLKNLENLKRLHLSENEIQDFSVLKNLTNLEELYLNDNQLKKIPEEIRSLKNLKVLSLAFNPLQVVDGLEELTHLEILNLEETEVEDFTPLKSLKHLRSLNLYSFKGKNEKESGIEFLKDLKNVTELRIVLREDIDPEPIGELKQLEVLDLLSPKLGHLDFIASLINLEELRIESMQITSLDPLKNIKSLRKLSAGNNEIKSLKPIGELTQLEELHLPFNQIKSLEPLESLTSLQNINLLGNKVKSLEGLENLERLTDLHLGKNQIEDLTPLSSLNLLKYLSISENKVKSLVPLEDLPSLGTLSVENNKIEDLSSLPMIPNLTLLYIDGNPAAKEVEVLEELKESSSMLFHIDVLEENDAY